MPKQPKRTASRLLVSVGVVLLMGIVAWGVINLTKEKAPIAGASTPPLTREILPDTSPPKTPDPQPSAKIPPQEQLPATSPSTPTLEETPIPEAPKTAHQGKAALEVLEKFLAATTLEERLPLILTQLPKTTLENGVLAKPFPANPKLAPDVQESTGDTTDFFFNVDFRDISGKKSPQLVLVRVEGNNPPQVVADPFLDSFGGRLAAFASEASEDPATFQVVVAAVAQITADRNVPNYENKLRLKLMPRDNEKEITSAYFTKISKLGQMLVTDGSGLRYGQARIAKVVLQWNMKEDPAKPFLEVVDIKGFHWNP